MIEAHAYVAPSPPTAPLPGLLPTAGLQQRAAGATGAASSGAERWGRE